MYADRNRRTQCSPASLTAAIGINGALIAALLFSAPDLLPPIEDFGPIEAINIPADPPPPPPKPVEKIVETKVVPQQSRIDTPPTKVDVMTPNDFDIVGPPLPPPPPMGDIGTGTTVTVDPAPPPPPVFVEASRDGRYAGDFQPDYPASERRAGNEGAVTVKVLIGPDGRVKAVEQVRAASSAFFDATRRQALARWRFKPATRGGVPVESWQTLTVRFQLEDA